MEYASEPHFRAARFVLGGFELFRGIIYGAAPRNYGEIGSPTHLCCKLYCSFIDFRYQNNINCSLRFVAISLSFCISSTAP